MIKGLDDKDLDFLFGNSNEKPIAHNSVADNQIKLPNGKIITLNNQQYEAIGRIRKWLKSNKTFFTLEGFSGSGKSTIIKKILDEYRGGVCVTATTHKAKKIISNTTGRSAKTLHSLLGLKPDVSLDEFNPNSPQFSPIAPPKICDYNFIVCDECSQINSELFKLIVEKAKDCRVKIIFLGDSGQAPPVKEILSPVFSQPDIEMYCLTIVERQQDTNPLMVIYDKLRNNLNVIDGGFLRESKINNLGEGIIFTVDKRKFREIVIEKFMSDEFKKDSDYCKGIAWKNATVMASNNVVRNIIIGEKSDVIERNDLLMAYRTITNEQQNYNIIENSADYHVVEKSGLEENVYGISGYRVKLREDLANKKFKFDDVFIIDSNNYNNLHLYGQMHDFFKDTAISNKKMWKKYYEFRRNNLLMVNIDKYGNGQLRNNNDKIAKDLDYGYFITAHKVQGSTYSHVMIISTDIEDNRNIVERNKLLYVAMSRPEKTCTMLTNRIEFKNI